MSQKDLALAASPSVQAQIAAAGGAVASLATASAAAEAEALKGILDRATAAAVGVLQGANSLASTLVATGNSLERQIAANKEDQAKLAKARVYYSATNNIFPLQKMVGIPTSKEVLAEYPNIDKVPDGWTAPAATTAAAG